MASTLSEKILAKAAGLPLVAPGDLIVAKPKVIAFNDGSAKYLEWFDKNEIRLNDPSNVIFCFDHFFRSDVRGGAVVQQPQVRAFARRQNVPAANVYDVGRHGLQHQVPAEEGWALPGTLFVGADSQSATMGGMGCFALAAVGEVHVIAAMGEVWLRVPEAVRINLTGRLPKMVLGKDVFLNLLSRLGNKISGRVVELAGTGVMSLSMDVRMAIANGSAQLGALTTLFPTDQRLIDYVTPRARGEFEVLTADSDANYAATHDFDLSEFDLMIAGPSSIETIRPLAEVEGTPVQAAYIGSCSSGRLEDLAAAAAILRGRKIHPSVRMVITPISSRVYQEAARQGIISTLLDANATVTIPGCGACFLGNQSPLILDPGEVCITGSVEVYDGRMGSKDARIYAATASVIAASAVEGRIANPRKYLT